ncbi:MAG: WD40 repeat domain-containing protein, partial [Actinomycetes bacterium]
MAPLGLAAMFGAAGLTGAMAAVPAAAVPVATAAAASVRAAPPPATVLFTISDDRITESSGLATSRRFKGVVYT